MTINTTNVTTGPYIGTGATDEYSYDFPIDVKTDLLVYRTDVGGNPTLLTVDTDYTVTSVGNDAGGTVVLTAGNLASGAKLFIRSNRPPTQLLSFANNTPLFPEQIGEGMDKLTMLVQQMQDVMLKFPSDVLRSTGDNVLPTPQSAKALGWDASGKLVNYDMNLLNVVGGIGHVSNVAALRLVQSGSTNGVMVTRGYYTEGDGGGGQYYMDASDTTSADNGGSIIVASDGARWKLLLPTGIISVRQFGAKLDGSTNDSAAVQAALNAHNLVQIPESSTKCILNTQITIASNKTLYINCTLGVTINNGTPGTPLLSITGSKVRIIFGVNGGIDFTSTTYKNWGGIYATGSAGMLSDIKVYGGYFTNIGIDSTAAFVVGFSGVSGGEITGVDMYNCGVVGNVSGGGFGIYSDNCENLYVHDNNALNVGSSAYNVSCGLNNRFIRNRAKNTTLFAFKGGYGIGPAVTGSVTPTTTTFSVAKNASSLKTLKVGQCIVIPRASVSTYPRGIIKTITDNTTYLTITLAKATATPAVGEILQPLDTGCVWLNNSSEFCGDNAFDQNGVCNIEIAGNDLSFSGWYQAAGVFAGLRAGVWCGYDNQGALNSQQNDGVYVHDNKIRHTYGSGVNLMVTENYRVHGNDLRDYNEGQDPSSVTPNYGGIDINRTGFYRAYNGSVCGNMMDSDSGYAAFIGFTARVLIDGNRGRSKCGIKLNTLQDTVMSNNQITSSGAGGYTYLISDDSGANPSSTVRVSKNRGYAEGATGHVFSCTDTNIIELQVDDDNSFAAANTNTILYNDNSTSSGTPAYSGYNGNVGEKPMRFTLGAGQTISLANYFSDAGTIGGVIIEGVARRGVAAGEMFEMRFYGSTSTSTGVFTSKGATGAGAFLAGGDFSTQVNTPNSGQINCRYTNNEAENVSMTLIIKSMSRT
jgi:hypothetical protein